MTNKGKKGESFVNRFLNKERRSNSLGVWADYQVRIWVFGIEGWMEKKGKSLAEKLEKFLKSVIPQ